MQAWITRQLTPVEPDRTMGVVRPLESVTPTRYRRAFFERIRAARVSAGKSPAEMAQLLGVPKDTYHRYETRTLLPHHLMEKFCRLTDKELDWLITGRPSAEGLRRPQPESSSDAAPARNGY
jgi:DNA-binding XRE family transcriptional regulator